MEWLEGQITLFQGEQDKYKDFSLLLETMLKKAAAKLAPTATVQFRVKSLASFAEKCLRKKEKYKEPVYQLTDLCGARVVAYSQEEVDALCRFVRANFEVDEKNSEDKLKILRNNEFGYRSVHFVVQTRPDGNLLVEGATRLLESINAPGPKGEPFRRKAEIQIRTYMQHVWADVFHDRLYKTAIKIPGAYQRQANAMAAQLETLDGLLDGLISRMDAYHGDLGAYLGEKEIRDEVEIQKTLLDKFTKEVDKPAIALRLARLQKSLGTQEGWNAVIATARPFLKGESALHKILQLEWGNALCRRHPAGSPEFLEGIQKLRELGDPDAKFDPHLEKAEANFRARALADLGWATAKTRRESFRVLSRNHFFLAHTLVPGNPYYLCRYLTSGIKESRNLKGLEPLQSWIQGAIRTCEEHVAVGVELPEALFSLFWFHWFSGRKPEGFAFLLRAACNSTMERLREEYASVLDLAKQLGMEEHAWVPELEDAAMTLLVCILARDGKPFEPEEELQKEFFQRLREALPENFLGDPKASDKHLILAGNASKGMSDKDVEEWSDILSVALDGLQGMVFGPGTSAGMGSALGNASRKLAERNGKPRQPGFRLLSVLPTRLPTGAVLHPEYDVFLLPKSPKPEFSNREPLFTWFTMLTNGLHPSRVRLLGVGGGPVSVFEYRLALAMGARVGLIAGSGRAAQEILEETPWWPKQIRDGQTALLCLPKDAMSIMAFVHAGDVREDERFAKAAQLAHEDYVRSQAQHEVRPELRPWETLSADFKLSNFHQVAFAETILNRAGFGLRAGNDIKPLDFSDSAVLPPDKLEMMAQMEHGRWNVERLMQGWRQGKTDKPNRVNKNLVPWGELTDEVKGWDRDAIKNIPRKMAEAGLEIYSLNAV